MRPKNSEKEGSSARTAGCSPKARCPVVAMGASAGGFDVFVRFFDRMPEESGIAFVLIQHLNPSHETFMLELLAKHTKMKVMRAENGLKIQPNHVYINAPGTNLTMEHCVLKTKAMDPGDDRRTIDHFFHSVATDQQDNVIGIVLSGAGWDGVMGLRSIRENGGLTIAQSPETAKFDSMPRIAISSGFTDLTLPVEEMPARIIEYARHFDLQSQRKHPEAVQQEVLEYLPKIFPLLREKTGHDFSGYKQSTLARRVQRRMQIMYLDSVAQYVGCLQEQPGEVEALFRDLLIGVTQFFRDPESFESLAKDVIPSLFQGKGAENQIRVWIPGCASGEEAYSLAMLLAEQAEREQHKPEIQLFATDLDSEALDFARKARYSDEIVQHLSPERLNRFFKKIGNGYEVIDKIRESCIFSPHNLIKDPPFSRLDLISCRNVLIYLESDLQKNLLPLFHYSLNPSGYLFLGPSENLASRSELFRTVDPKHRIFQRRPALLHSSANVPMLASGNVTRLQALGFAPSSVTREPSLTWSIERIILEEYAPASVIINKQGETLYFSGETGKFLHPPSGVPSNKIVAMARKNLRLELRTAVHRAITTGEEVVRRNLLVKHGLDHLQIDLTVRPLTELGNGAELYIVLFRELIPSQSGAKFVVEDNRGFEHAVIKQLENELSTTRDDLQSTIEELETTNEELKSANEELLSMNEELQSANEELQTSKEEIQSTNDELQRKMEEMDLTNVELRRTHEDRAHLAALVENSGDAIISKTLDGVITTWNKAAERIFGYAADEMIGQSILKIIPPELHEDEERILEKLRRGERVEHYETKRLAKSGRLVEVSLTSSPIRDPEGFIIGASKIARDITAQRAATRASLLLASIVDSSDDAIISKTLDGTVTSWNRAAEKMFDYTALEMIGRPITDLFPSDRLDEEPQVISKISRGERIEHFETVRKTKDGRLIDISLTISPIRDLHGKIVGASKIARDITAQKASARASQLLASIVDSSEDAIISKTLDGIITSWNKAAEKLFGYTEAEIIGRPITDLFPADRLDEEPRIISRITSGDRIEHFETVRKTKDGRLIDISLTISPIKDSLGRIIGASKIARDISSRKETEQQLRRSEEQLRVMADSIPQLAWMAEPNGDVFWFNRRWYEYTGTTPEQVRGWGWQSVHDPVVLPRVIERWKESLRKGEPFEMEFPLRGANGAFQWFLTRIHPLRDSEGTIVRWLGTSTDIDQAKQAKEELEERVKERTASLRETTEQLETFCYTVAHDLRSPLRAQQSFAQGLLDDYKSVLDETGQEYAKRILRSAQRLDKLVHDLLTYSRLSRNDIKFEKVELEKVLRDVQAAHADEIRSSAAVISTGPLLAVRAYEPTLNLVITNLIANALKFVKPGEAPRINIWNEKRDGTVRLWVEDQGIGISPENTEKIFGVFHRLHPIDQYPGTGIGLAIVQKGVERMGGHVGVESELGKGSRFWIELPATQS